MKNVRHGIEGDKDRNFKHRSKERPEPPKNKVTPEFLMKEELADKMTELVKESFNKVKSEVTKTWSILKEGEKE